MLTIRLQRIGKKKFPTYRIIVSEKGRDTKDKYLENLGTYNPHLKENDFLPVAERIQYWIGKGAQTSGTIHNLLVKAGIIQGKKVKSVFLTEGRKKKIADKSASAPQPAQPELAPKAETTPAPAETPVA